jgi:hypothetical protein
VKVSFTLRSQARPERSTGLIAHLGGGARPAWGTGCGESAARDVAPVEPWNARTPTASREAEGEQVRIRAGKPEADEANDADAEHDDMIGRHWKLLVKGQAIRRP